jgi:nucleoside-diphosphate-sugar epimerase
LLDPASMIKAVTGVDTIIHLAAVFRTRDTDAIWRANREGTANIIDAVRWHAPHARFIMASTSHVYGADIPRPGREDDAVSPEHPYPASKVACERDLRASGLNWSVLRLPYVYGDGDGHLSELPKHIASLKWHPA